MAGATDRIDCWLLLVETAEENEPGGPAITFEASYRNEAEANARGSALSEKFEEEEEAADPAELSVVKAAHVVGVSCAALVGDLWAVQGTYGGIPGDPTLYPSREAAEKAFRKFAAEEGIEVQPNVGEGLFAEGDKQEIRMYGPIRVAER